MATALTQTKAGVTELEPSEIQMTSLPRVDGPPLVKPLVLRDADAVPVSFGDPVPPVSRGVVPVKVTRLAESDEKEEDPEEPRVTETQTVSTTETTQTVSTTKVTAPPATSGEQEKTDNPLAGNRYVMRERRLSVRVPRPSLQAAKNNGLQTLRRRVWRVRTRVNVEPSTHNRSDVLFYAPFPRSASGVPTATQYVSSVGGTAVGSGHAIGYETGNSNNSQINNNNNSSKKYTSVTTKTVDSSGLTQQTQTQPQTLMKDDDAMIVRRDHDFEITFVGFQVASADVPCFYTNDGLIGGGGRGSGNGAESHNGGGVILFSSAGGALTDLLNHAPSIHVDVDPAAPVLSDAFIPVPASSALALQRTSKDKEKSENKIIPIKFSLMAAAQGTGRTGGLSTGMRMGRGVTMNGRAHDIPPAVADAMSVASAIGKKGLRKLADGKSGSILSKDVEFLLAESEADKSANSNAMILPQASAFLRYGYYFFLKEMVDAKLYAQTDASSQTVPLLMRRQGYTQRMAARGENEFFPLTGVSYVVLRVTPGCTHTRVQKSGEEIAHNRERLSHMFQVHQLLSAFANLK